MSAVKTVLVVDDEPRIVQLARDYLENAGFAVLSAGDGPSALHAFRTRHPDLVVLDLGLPGLDGLDVTRTIRTESQTPIVMLTARDDELDKLLGLELGADDYITKPFSIREFRSRVKAVLRRSQLAHASEPARDAIVEDGLRIDLDKRVVELAGAPVRLTYVEFEILVALAAHPGRVYSRQTLLERVWGDSAYRDPRTVDVHIRHLREKLEADPRHPELLLTVRGVGYSFRDR